MKISTDARWLLAAIGLSFLLCAPSGCVAVDRSARHQAEPAPYVAFVQELTPYGEWLYVPGIGRVWRPYRSLVGARFVPYATGGRWLYTRHGWMFDSRYDFGWATFHYGNWVHLADAGWVWIPGDTWAPAWVDWRYGGGYVGWAPLPPPWYRHAPERWCFVEARSLADHDYIDRHLLPPHRYHAAESITRNQGALPPRGYVERYAPGPVRLHDAAPPPPPGRVARAEPRPADRPPPPPEDRWQPPGRGQPPEREAIPRPPPGRGEPTGRPPPPARDEPDARPPRPDRDTADDREPRPRRERDEPSPPKGTGRPRSRE